MSKVLIFTRKENLNPSMNMKMKELLDCEFSNIDAREGLSVVAEHQVKLVVIYLTKLSADEEIEVNKFLQNSGNVPVILAGDRENLGRYYGKTKAKIIRYVVTPILLSEYVKEIQECLNSIEGISSEDLEKGSEKFVEAAPKKILVIDDDIIMLRTISNWLSDLFSVSVAKSGAAALQFLAKQTPDLILLDYEMPVCDGIQTLQMIRNEPNLKDIPVFFLTAVDDVEHVKKALELKPEGYILKSEGSDYLISKIKDFF